MTQSNAADQAAISHIYGAQVNQQTHPVDLRPRPPHNHVDMQYFATDSDFLEDQQLR